MAWGLCLTLSFLLLAAGLPGSFILDDSGNLNGLGKIAVGQWGDIATFSLQGIAGPSGRPLSLLSFALQHESWPDAPEHFKLVNISIHLLNGCLLFWVLFQLQSLRGIEGTERRWIPLAASALWLIWPIHISAVLYVIQRMTLLSATCLLLGTGLYLTARTQALRQGGWPWANLLLACSLFVGLVLGILCKENAIIFTLLILAAEATLLSRIRPPLKGWRPLLWAPLVAMAAYLILINPTWQNYSYRAFDLEERLLTQTRIMWMYIVQILAPTAGSLRFLYDNYPISKGLLAPMTTLLASLAWLVTAVAAWVWRKGYPVAAFSVLFFLACHALESTILPLELVFEHRNYLASASLAFGICTGIGWLFRRSGTRVQVLLALLSLSYAASIGATTLNLARFWAEPLVQKRYWYTHNPDSTRVHMELASQLLIDGYIDAGARQYEVSARRFPNDLGFPVARVELACYYPELKPETLRSTERSLRTGTAQPMTGLAYLDRIARNVTEHGCTTYAPEDVRRLIKYAKSNPAFRFQMADLYVLDGVLCSFSGDFSCAKSNLDVAIGMRPSPKLLIQAASWEATNGHYSEAERYLALLSAQTSKAPLKHLAVSMEAGKVRAQIAANRTQEKPLQPTE